MRVAVQDPDQMEAVYHYIFHQSLCADPKETPVLLTESPWIAKASREKMVELLFEKFEIPGIYIAKNPVLAA